MYQQQQPPIMHNPGYPASQPAAYYLGQVSPPGGPLQDQPIYPPLAYPSSPTVSCNMPGYPPAPGYPPQTAKAAYTPAHSSYPPAPQQPYGQPGQVPPTVGFVSPPPLPQGYNSAPSGAPYGSALHQQPGPPFGSAPPTPSSYPGSSAPYPGGPLQPAFNQSAPYGELAIAAHTSLTMYATPPTTPTPAYPPQSNSMYGNPPTGGSIYPGVPSAAPIALPQVDIVAPSIRPIANFNAQHDCEVLRKAMKGIGTDEAALIAVLCKRNWQQRAEIERSYKQIFGKDLVKEIVSETNGNFRRVLKRLLKTPVELAAYELRHAMEGAGTDEQGLIEIICTKTNAELTAIKQKYSELYKRSLEKDVESETSGHFRRLLIALLSASRSENLQVDWATAAVDAKSLYEAGEKRLGTDESRFNAVLCSRSYPQLRAVFEVYKREYKKDIEQVIRSEFSGDIANGSLAVVGCIRNKQTFFANRLHASMVCAGTRDNMLIRIVVSRADVDLAAIKTEYQRIHGKTLAHAISGDCSGDYKKALLALLGD